MSRKVHKLTHEYEDKIWNELIIQQQVNKYAKFSKPKSIQAFQQTDVTYHVPFAFDKSLPRPTRENFSTISSTSLKFEGKLTDEQNIVKKEALSHLNKDGSVILACYPGFGKTVMGIKIAISISLKTLFLTHRIVLIKQWKKAIEQFCPNASYQVLTGKTELEDHPFYIMNAMNVIKHPREFYKDIGCVIVDEAHVIMAELFSKSLLHLSPRYLIGLSATPFRYDDLNILFDLYFGTNKIEREFYCPHSVYIINSGFTPEISRDKSGNTNWGKILDEQATCEDRNELIIRILKFFRDRTFMVICKRVVQAEYLIHRLEEEKESVTNLIGNKQDYDEESRILVVTTNKGGNGLNHTKLDALILAGDVLQYFSQVLGRVFRRKDVRPLVFDIVDDNYNMKRHLNSRKELYEKHGGRIRDLNMDFPNNKIFKNNK